MTLSDPRFLIVGAALAALIAIAFARRARRARRLAAFLGGIRAARRLARDDLLRVQLERIALLALASLAIAVAAAGPRQPSSVAGAEPAAPSVPRSVMLAIDVSSSMQRTDVAPTRLAAAVRVAQELVASMENSEVGLLLLAGKAYTLSPPTFDHRGLRYLLTGVTPTTASPWDGGSRLSAGIREAVAQLTGADDPGRERSIVLISDAATSELEEDAASAAREAVASGVRLHTIGIAPDVGGGPGAAEPFLSRLARIGEGSYTEGVAFTGAGDGTPAALGGRGRVGLGTLWNEADATFWLTVCALLLVLLDGLLDGPVRLGGRGSVRGAP